MPSNTIRGEEGEQGLSSSRTPATSRPDARVDSAPRHTPGPWSVGSLTLNDGAIAVRAEEGRVALVECLTDFKRGEGHSVIAPVRDANARLIAAAPEMLEALRDMVFACDDPQPDPNISLALALVAVLPAARAAIAKALGEPA